MTRADQDRIVRRLVEQGVLDGTELPSRSGDGDELLDPIEFLLRRGFIDASAVEAAARALARADETHPTNLVTGPTGAADSGPAEATSQAIPRELFAWDRYHVLRRLGRGGSATVYEAHDPRLDRAVALKLLASADGGALREARMQARVAHPGVCQVHEVGWLGAHPFIAMQLVKGETLHVAAKEMTREEIVCAVRDAAGAVHAAHAIGLVHRDLKPGNLMIERAHEGGAQCYVLDFGLAKEASAQSDTVTGSVLGTPAFMAPEQARGDVRRIDRRTDVYGLGATLYDALAGCPPFSGEAAGMLEAVLSEEPTPLRKRDPSVAVDLDTIVMKCLEKDPSRRYDSARALADDLTCYLTGEPIRARRAGAADWLFRRVKRNPALAAVSVMSVLFALTLGGGWARARASAREQAEEARRFGQEAEAIETTARLTYLAPLHDTRPDRERLRARMRALETRTEQQSGAARAAGHEAAGRGALSLHAFQEAREHLDAAWEEGSRTPETAYARARTYTALYEEALTAARALKDPGLRAERIARLESELREPARASLAQAQQGSPERAPLIAGWIAHHEGRHDEAVALARQGAEARPWDYEARRLEGDAHRAAANAEETRGSYEAALARFGQAADAYAEAAAIGRSDAEAHASECSARLQAITLRIDLLLRAVDAEAFARALAACERAVIADGDRPDVAEQKAHLLQLRAVQAIERGGEPGDDLDMANAMAEEVIATHPERASGHATLGLGLFKRAGYEAAAGLDSRPTLAAAIDALERATELDPEMLVAQNNLGVLYRMRADDELRAGRDPRGSLDLAVARYERSAELDPTFAGVWNNIGRARALEAEYELRRGLPATGAIAAAIAAQRKATAALPEVPAVHNNLGSALYLQAVAVFLGGGDPGPPLAEAQRSFEQTIARNATYAFAWKNRGDAELLGADHALRKGQSAAAMLARAVTDYETALRAKPTYAGAHRGLSAAHRLSAYELLGRGLDATGAAAAAAAALAGAAALAPAEDPDLVAAREAGARLSAAIAAHDLARRAREPRRRAELAEAAREATAAAREKDPLGLWPARAKGVAK